MNKHPNDFYRFCPKCGASLQKGHRDERERLICTACGFVFYQVPKPCSGNIIHNERGEIMLVKRSRDPQKETWDVPGGFMDLDEDADAAMKREIDEELHVPFILEQRMGGYFDWYEFQGFNEPVLVFYYVGRIEGDPKPDDDIAAYQWFSLDALPDNIAFDHIRRAIADYVKEKKS